MASKTIEEMMQKASAKDKNLIQNQVQSLRNFNYQIDHKPQQENPPEGGSKGERKLDAPNPTHTPETPEQNRRASDRIKQSMPDKDKAKSVDHGQEAHKTGSSVKMSLEKTAPTLDKGR